MLQNARKYLDCRFFHNLNPALRFANTPLFHCFKVLTPELVIGYSKQKTLHMNRPFCVGFAVLELSKYLMYSVYYNEIQKKIPGVRLLMTDTDSFVMVVPGSTPEKALEKINHLMDYSNLPSDHELFTLKRKQEIGFFKDELKMERVISRAVFIRSKCYCLETKPRKTITKKNTKKSDVKISKCDNIVKCKGIKKSLLSSVGFDTYKSVLTSLKNVSGCQTSIRAFNHRIYTVREKKTMFSSFDDKASIHISI